MGQATHQTLLEEIVQMTPHLVAGCLCIHIAQVVIDRCIIGMTADINISSISILD